MKHSRPMTTDPLQRIAVGAALILACLLVAAAAAPADDRGSRHHAEGQYDAASSTYRVVAGDELGAIAERFGVTLEELTTANKQSSTVIEIGQRLAIPGGPAETAEAAAATTDAKAKQARKSAPKPPYVYGDAYKAGIEAYIYGLPLVLMDQTMRVTTQAGSAGEYSAPMGQLGRMKTQVSPDFKNVVRISLDGLWSFASVDLDQGPVVLTVPDTEGRYYVAQALNLWTDDFASIGTRNTGPGNFLIVGPDWNGTAPGDIKQTFRSTTRYAWILTQIQVTDPKDYPAANAIGARQKLTPLSQWGKPYTPPVYVPMERAVDVVNTPLAQVQAMSVQAFFQRLAMLMKDNPPYPADAPMLKLLKTIGVEPGKDFDFNRLPPGVGPELERAVQDAWALIETAVLKMPAVNGWVNPRNLGAYGTDYGTRAVVAWLGLGALIKEDAMYPTAFKDGAGDLLDFSKKYVMHFAKDQMPPCKGPWSISMYQGNYYTTSPSNPSDKFGVLSGDPFQYNADGSLDIYVQPESPASGLAANWLPNPPGGPMNLTIRCYWPKKSMLDGTYKIPPLTRVD